MPRPLYRGFRGDHLRTLREARGWTQEQLAVRIRAAPTMIGKWELGHVTPGSSSVAKLAAALEVPPQEFTDVDPAAMTVVELRIRAGLSRPEAADVAGVPVRRLAQYERLTCRPTDEDARVLAEVYGADQVALLASWDRDRAAAYPGLPAQDEAC